MPCPGLLFPVRSFEICRAQDTIVEKPRGRWKEFHRWAYIALYEKKKVLKIQRWDETVEAGGNSDTVVAVKDSRYARIYLFQCILPRFSLYK